MTGAPVFMYDVDKDYDTAAKTMEAFTLIDKADDNKYLMGASTSTKNGDSVKTACGLAYSHAYTMIEAFTVTGTKAGTKETVFHLMMMRNPWGRTTYKEAFMKDDPFWEVEAHRTQVPMGVDPRTSDKKGIFIVSKEQFVKDTGCFKKFYIAHVKDSSYIRKWYD